LRNLVFPKSCCKHDIFSSFAGDGPGEPVAFLLKEPRVVLLGTSSGILRSLSY
jgi:hypothetical protein